MGYETFMKFYPLTLDDLPDEVWLPIPDWQDCQVSTFGRVKRFYKNGKQKIIKPTLRRNYLRVGLRKNGERQKSFSVHRLVALCFIPNPENKPQVNHRDGYKLNCHVSNLEWCTRSENVRHAFDNGLIVATQGESRPEAKLTNEQVLYIRENPLGLTTYELAKMFSVSQSIISEIQIGKRWKHVGGIIRPKFGVPSNIRNQIRAEYQNGVRGFGYMSLAKKYNVSKKTIHDIIHKNEEA